jgi:hypothetical protein
MEYKYLLGALLVAVASFMMALPSFLSGCVLLMPLVSRKLSLLQNASIPADPLVDSMRGMHVTRRVTLQRSVRVDGELCGVWSVPIPFKAADRMPRHSAG